MILDIAQTILDGFDRHYRLFREVSAGACQRFEAGDWEAAAAANRDRIQMYDQRVKESVEGVIAKFPDAETDEPLWPRIKIAYIGLLYDHQQPELAETFFNSVACRVLHRSYYHNENLFWRPAISTDYIETSEPTYRCYYPRQSGLRRAILKLVTDFRLESRYHNLRYDVRCLMASVADCFPTREELRPNFQIQVLSSLFFRNRAAYIVGRVYNGNDSLPIAIPILKNSDGELYLDTIITSTPLLLMLFSFSRAYFMVNMDVPSAYVDFLRTLLPGKPSFEIYNMLGLQKQGKTMFYRELHHHLRYSSDNFIIAPGIRGMVMIVFTLPSFPYVFKIIRDHFEPPKEGNKDLVKEKYLLVKYHDRVGRLADTLEYSQVGFPLSRIDSNLLAELKCQAASNIEIDGEQLIVKHVYIERRMIPLNEYLTKVDGKTRRHAINEYGNAIRELASANIFPGDMMLKNFGVTRHRRVVFYDYDEICYMTECKFRRIPPAGSWEEEMMAEPSYSVESGDVFPEQFSQFFFSDDETRQEFYKYHRDLIEPAFWIKKREQILAGQPDEFLPYPKEQRFIEQYPDRTELIRSFDSLPGRVAFSHLRRLVSTQHPASTSRSN